MKNAKRILVMLLVLAMIIGTIGCTGKATTPEATEAQAETTEAPAAEAAEATIAPISGEFDWINTKDDIAAPLEEMIAAFNAEYPDIKVTVETLSSNSDEVIQSRDAAGDLPDLFPVFNIGPDALYSYVNAGKLADVSQLKVFQALPDDVKQMVTTPDGKAYSIILSTTAYGVIYNKADFEKAGITEVPRTLDAMADACAKLKNVGIVPFAVGAKDGWTVSNQIWRAGLDYAFPKEWNAKMYAGEASFSDYGYDIFPFLDLVLANCNDKPLDTDYMTQLTMMAEGSAAMVCQGPWAYTNIIGMAPEMADAYGYFPLPFSNDESRNVLFTMQEMAYVVSAKADLAAIDEFLSFMVLGNGKEIFGNSFNVMNPYGIQYAGNPILTDVQKYIDEGKYLFDFQDNNRTADFFMVDWTILQDYIAGKLTQQQVLDNMDAAWAEIAAKGN